ncbi:MAG: P-loop NTPase [Bdellovibrionia bacterium]
MERDLTITSAIRSGNNSSSTPLWTVASGKGGVGKTFIASSLAISLVKLGHKVILIDLDLSGANVHTSLGLSPSFLNIRQYFEGNKELTDLLIPTTVPNLSYIQGFWDSWIPTEYTKHQIEKIIPDIKKLKADVVIVDLGAGATEAHLDLFKASDEKILVSTPEPTSIEKTYRFLEAYICSSIRDNATPECFADLLSTLRMHRQRSLTRPFSFKSYLKERDGIVFDYFEQLASNPVRLIVNQSRSMQNEDLGHSMKSVARKYYDIAIDYVGAIDYDNAVWQSAKTKEPVLIAQPFTPLAGQFLSTCKHLIDHEELRAVV